MKSSGPTRAERSSGLQTACRRRASQKLVAVRLTQPVVDLGQIVDIDEEIGHALARRARRLQVAVGLFLHAAAIKKPGEIVVIGEKLDARIGLFQNPAAAHEKEKGNPRRQQKHESNDGRGLDQRVAIGSSVRRDIGDDREKADAFAISKQGLEHGDRLGPIIEHDLPLAFAIEHRLRQRIAGGNATRTVADHPFIAIGA